MDKLDNPSFQQHSDLKREHVEIVLRKLSNHTDVNLWIDQRIGVNNEERL